MDTEIQLIHSLETLLLVCNRGKVTELKLLLETIALFIKIHQAEHHFIYEKKVEGTETCLWL